MEDDPSGNLLRMPSRGDADDVEAHVGGCSVLARVEGQEQRWSRYSLGRRQMDGIDGADPLGTADIAGSRETEVVDRDDDEVVPVTS